VRILFDQGVPAPLREFLPGHAVRTAHELSWSGLRNDELLARAEKEFDALVSTDRNLARQQNQAALRLAILVLPTTSWPRIEARTERIAMAVASLRASQYVELRF
jgi:predicted nuclease of predicted toxin-antitoxin system